MKQPSALLYVMLSRTGRVLYVGMTSNFEQRWALHQARSPWALHVREVHTGPLKPLAETRTDERQWIQDCRPLFNRMYNADYEELGKTARVSLYAERLAELPAAA